MNVFIKTILRAEFNRDINELLIHINMRRSYSKKKIRPDQYTLLNKELHIVQVLELNFPILEEKGVN